KSKKVRSPELSQSAGQGGQSSFAMYCGRPEGIQKPPAACSRGPLPSSKAAKTRAETAVRPGSPPGSADHCSPSHSANPLIGSPPAVVKLPPTYSSSPRPRSNTPSPETLLSTPPPTSDHDAP